VIPLKDDIPSYSAPVVNYTLIAVNVLAFFYELSQPSFTHFIFRHGFIPYMFFEKHHYITQFLNIFESMFLHGGFMHILGNMWFLWIFGDNVEDRLGHVNFLLFYLAGGVVAFLIQGAVTPHLRAPVIGASGAISAVIGAYLVFFPRARITTLIFIFLFFTFIQIPAWLFIIIWFFMQYFNGVLALAGGFSHIAWFAHIGGFSFGFLFAKYYLKRL